MITSIILIKCKHCRHRYDDPYAIRGGAPTTRCAECARPDWASLETSHIGQPSDTKRQVIYQLVHHSKNHDTAVATMNRLVKKHFQLRFDGKRKPPLDIRLDQVSVDLQFWDTAKIMALKTGEHRKQFAPLDAFPELINLPAVVLRLGDIDCVLDGNTRLNLRRCRKMPAPHPIYLVSLVG